MIHVQSVLTKWTNWHVRHSLCSLHSLMKLLQLDNVTEYIVYELWSCSLGEQVAMNRQHVALRGKEILDVFQ